MDGADEIYLMDHPDSTEEIPIIDIAPFLAGEPGAAGRIGKELRHVTETVGFFYLAGHGVPQSHIDMMFAEARRFHALPLAVKEAIPRVDNTDYLRMSEALTTTANIIDGAAPNLNAAFIFNRERAPDDPDALARKPFRQFNNWPEGLPGFKENVLDYLYTIEALGQRMLPLWAASLDLPADYFAPFFKSPHITMRISHYPHQKVVGNRQYGLAPHTDNCLMTILAQANVPGLAVRMPSGHWRLVDIIPGTFVVNTGNLMVRWTNDRYLSTKHRVINISETDRYVFPVFFGPDHDALIECLPTCTDAANPPRHKAMTYLDLMMQYFVMKQAKSTGSK